jgi:putative ABC transport system permease protein
MDSLILANVRQRPLRTAISIIGVSLGVILIVLVVGLARGVMRDSADRQSNVDAELRFYPPGKVDVTMGANSMRLPVRYRDALFNGVQPTAEDPDIEPKAAIQGLSVISPVGQWVESSVGGIGFRLVDGIEYETFSKATEVRIVQGRPIGDGKTPETASDVMVDRDYLESNKDSNGQPLTVGSRIKVLDNDFTIVGVYEPAVMARVKIPLYRLQQLLGGADNCSYLLIKTENRERSDQVSEAIKQNYPGHAVIATKDLPALFSRGIVAVEIFLNVVIILAVVISTLVILLAMYTTIIERTREIGILKSLGASKVFILLTIEKEAALISILGVALGFVFALLGKVALESSTKLIIDLQPKWLLISALIGVVSGVAGALYPAMRAANIDPIEALSYE